MSDAINRSAEEVVVCGSSLRAAPLPLTLERARRLGPSLGISRVTEITRLDRIGIPVYASVRPAARPGSLCVNAGKGVTADEAQASAWMEAIEYALAEPGASPVSVLTATARDVLDGRTCPDAIFDFCPHVNAEILLDAPMPCVNAEELLSGTECLVPAEMVFLPGEPLAPARYFGSSSNGLASGNSLLEATVHGLAEVIENDIRSFHMMRDTSVPVSLDSLPLPARLLVERITAAGLSVYVRHLDNPFGLPCFSAVIADADADIHMLLNGGHGCHPHRLIALMRAICEAAQSRLSVIHGGRDDLEEMQARYLSLDAVQRAAAMQQMLARMSTDAEAIDYETVNDCAARAPDLPAAFRTLTDALRGNGLHRVCRVVFTPPDASLHVVKILVPQLEACAPGNPRFGRRLTAFWKECKT